ncbi:hypothetical protein HanPSC8_Chr09g0376061 [Helianthus annuus]|nr:hypothetical protein HanPSC8_Chr09g0376061 [Helianthus annuus]
MLHICEIKTHNHHIIPAQTTITSARSARSAERHHRNPTRATANRRHSTPVTPPVTPPVSAPCNNTYQPVDRPTAAVARLQQTRKPGLPDFFRLICFSWVRTVKCSRVRVIGFSSYGFVNMSTSVTFVASIVCFLRHS